MFADYWKMPDSILTGVNSSPSLDNCAPGTFQRKALQGGSAAAHAQSSQESSQLIQIIYLPAVKFQNTSIGGPEQRF
jgi:hypothetical protein